MSDETPDPHIRRDLQLPRWMWLADGVIALLLALAAWSATFGGWLWTFGPVELSLRSPLRLVVIAVGVAAVTWIARPSLPPWRRWELRADAFSARFPVAGAVLPVVIGTRAVVLLVGLMAVKLIGFPVPLTGVAWGSIWPHDLVNLPWRWDTGWYTGIAIDGYTWHPDPTAEQSIVFFPAFPMLMRLGAALLLMPQSPVAVVWSGVAIAWISFGCACAYIYKMTRDEFGDDAALAAITLLAAYPFAAFYSTAYSEGLFLLVNVAAFYHFRRRELVRAAIFGLVAGLTRPNGCLLSVALAAVWLFGEWAPRTSITEREPRTMGGAVRALAVASTPGIGLLIYSAFIWSLTGDPLAWLNRQQAWHRDVHLFDPRLAMQFHMARHWLDGTALLLVLVALWPIAKRLGYAAAFFAGASTLIPFLNGGLLSVGRFTCIAFPLFIWLGLAVPPRRRPLVTTIFGMGQALVAAAFFSNRPLY